MLALPGIQLPSVSGAPEDLVRGRSPKAAAIAGLHLGVSPADAVERVFDLVITPLALVGGLVIR